MAALQCAAVVRACKKQAMAFRLASEEVLELVSRKLVWLVLLFSNLVRREGCVCQLPAEHGWCWACSLLNVAVRQLWPDPHLLCGGRGPDQRLWRADLGDWSYLDTTPLFCGAQSQLGVHQFLSVKSENFFKFLQRQCRLEGCCLHACCFIQVKGIIKPVLVLITVICLLKPS